jgi:hypothetical protein
METSITTKLPQLPAYAGTLVQKLLGGAEVILDRFGLKPGNAETTQIADLLQDLTTIDPARIDTIARVMSYAPTFNQLARDKLKDSTGSNRFGLISDEISGVREELKTLDKQWEDGKINLVERLRNKFVLMSKGSAIDRFNKARKIFNEEYQTTAKGLDDEETVLSAYGNFRITLTEAAKIAYEVRDIQKTIADNAKADLDTITAELSSYTGSDVGKMELVQKQALSRDAYKKEDARFGLIQNVAIDLSTNFQATEVVMNKAAQTHDMTEQVKQRMLSFFTMSETTVTALAVAYSASGRLRNATLTLDTYKTQINECLKDLTKAGGKMEQQAMELAHGALIDANTFKDLFDKVVEVQENITTYTQQYRAANVENARVMDQVYTDGMKRLTNAVTGYKQAISAEVQAPKAITN